MSHICAIINSTKGGYGVKNISSGIADMLWMQWDSVGDVAYKYNGSTKITHRHNF